MHRRALYLSLIGITLGGHALSEIPVFTNDTTRLAFYGKMHMALESYSVRGITDASDAEGTRFQSHSSRIGLLTSQKVNDDIKVKGQIEGAVALAGSDDGANPFCGTRNTYLGLESQTAGELRAGRHDVAYKMVSVKNNLFPDSLGKNDNIITEGAARADDTLLYLSPKWHNTQLLGSVSLTDGQEYHADQDAGQTVSAGTLYDGALGVMGLGVETQESDLLSATNTTTGYDSAKINYGTPKFNGFQFMGAFEIRNGEGKPDETNYSIGLAQDIGKFILKGNYAWKEVDAAEANANGITAAIYYKASNALELYIMYAAIDNEAHSKIDFSDGPIGKTTSSSSALSPGDDVNVIAMGAIFCF